MQGFKILTVALCALVSLVAADGGRITLPKPQQKNVCQNKEDGVFLPVAGSCSKYIICSGGSAIEQDCGGYHFSTKYSACDLPERVGCVITESLPSPTPSKSVCSGQKDGTKLSVPGSDTKYHLCKKEKATLKDCGSLNFDALTKECITEKQVVVPNPTLPPCYAVANGISLPVPGNPRQYYFCMNNKAYLKDCGNMYFVAKHSACVISPDSTAPIVTPRPEILRRTKTPSTQHETESSACYGQPDGVSLPISGKPQQYNFCMNNKAFLKDCGNRMVFVAKYSACAPSSSIQPVEELEITSATEELLRHVCKNKSFGARVALPGHCSLYAICTANTGFLKTCGWREFNSKTASCDLPQNVLCKAYEETPEQPDYQPTPKPSTSTLAQRICLDHNDGSFVAAPGSCSEFFFCLKKHGYRKSCGKNRHFNPKTMICVDSKESKCVDVLFKKSQRAVDPSEDTSCINRESGTLLRSPSGCGQFIICDNHVSREMDCPAGLHFNVEDNVCDWPTNAKCA